MTCPWSVVRSQWFVAAYHYFPLGTKETVGTGEELAPRCISITTQSHSCVRFATNKQTSGMGASPTQYGRGILPSIRSCEIEGGYHAHDHCS